jgi:hypothetical protein
MALRFAVLPYIRTAKVKIMSKVIAGIFTLIGGLGTLYMIFVLHNTSYDLNYNDPKLHMSLFQTGYMPQFMICILMLTVGLIFFFVAKEKNLK